MRVSKTVREYIEEQVASKFPKTEEELNFEQLSNLVNLANQEYEKRMSQLKDKVVAELMEEYNFPQQVLCKNNSIGYNQFTTWNTQAKQDSDNARRVREKAMQEKIKGIIVSLELGGTKADLEKMLAEI